MRLASTFKRRPIAANLFNTWIETTGPISEWASFLRPGTIVSEMPYELLSGVMQSWMIQLGVYMIPRYSAGGKLSVNILIRNRFGTLRPYNHTAAFADHEHAWRNAYEMAMEKVEKVIKAKRTPGIPAGELVDDEFSLIGVSMDGDSAPSIRGEGRPPDSDDDED